MSFLSDLGRSNALSSVQNVANIAINLKKLGMEETQMERTAAIDLEKLEMLKAEEERAATKSKFEMDALKEKQRLADIPYPVAKYLGVDFANDPAKKMMYDKAKELGIVENIGEIDMVREKNFLAFAKYMQEDLGWTSNLNKTNMSKLQQQAAKLEMDIPTMKKPEDRAVAQEQLKTIYDQIGGLGKAQIAIDLEHQKKKELEEAKAKAFDWQTVRDDESSTGWAKINLKTGDKVLEVAPPASAVAEKKLGETERHNKAMEEIRKVSGGGTDKKTALIKNTEFLAGLGWNKDEAAKMLTSSKPMSKDAFIGQATLRIMTNELIPEDERANRIKEAIAVYDAAIAKSGTSPTTPKVIPPAGYTDTGKLHNGKKLYHNPKATKGKEYWVEE